MKKIVINTCHGGFSLSPKGLMHWAKLNDRDCFFFKTSYDEEDKYVSLTLEEAQSNGLFWTAFSVPNPNEVLPDQSNFHEMTLEERAASNEEYKKYSISNREIKRDDPTLIQTIKELKKEANGACADLKVVSIPDDVDWKIEEYDGAEWVAEVHRTWN